jgi:Mg2+ and Co2+ transporter CorA
MRCGLISKLFGILDFYNAAANRDSANKASMSNKSMISLTLEMKSLTHKTKQETVMMRVITFVTMIFLPGTFISVSNDGGQCACKY